MAKVKKSDKKQECYEKSDLAKKIGKEKLKESKKRIANIMKGWHIVSRIGGWLLWIMSLKNM